MVTASAGSEQMGVVGGVSWCVLNAAFGGCYSLRCCVVDGGAEGRTDGNEFELRGRLRTIDF